MIYNEQALSFEEFLQNNNFSDVHNNFFDVHNIHPFVLKFSKSAIIQLKLLLMTYLQDLIRVSVVPGVRTVRTVHGQNSLTCYDPLISNMTKDSETSYVIKSKIQKGSPSIAHVIFEKDIYQIQDLKIRYDSMSQLRLQSHL